MPDGVRCFLLVPTDRVRRRLRRYVGTRGDPSAPDEVARRNCPSQGGYHDASVPLDELDAEFVPCEQGVEGCRHYAAHLHAGPPPDDPRWPTACGCGYVFQEDDARQVFIEHVYRRGDTGELTTIRDAPGGAMWDATWLGSAFAGYRGADGRSLVIKLPNGHDWHVDGTASNCGLKAGRPTGVFCWQRTGEPPNVTVASRSCPNCGVGGGSVQGGNWHGFLTDGVLHP